MIHPNTYKSIQLPVFYAIRFDCILGWFRLAPNYYQLTLDTFENETNIMKLAISCTITKKKLLGLINHRRHQSQSPGYSRGVNSSDNIMVRGVHAESSSQSSSTEITVILLSHCQEMYTPLPERPLVYLVSTYCTSLPYKS